MINVLRLLSISIYINKAEDAMKQARAASDMAMVRYWDAAGLAVSGNNGSVSLLDLDGNLLWSRTPRGSSASPSSRPSFASWSDAGQLMVHYARSLTSAERDITVFDKDGNTLLYRDGLNSITRAQSARRCLPWLTAQRRERVISTSLTYLEERRRFRGRRFRHPTASRCRHPGNSS